MIYVFIIPELNLPSGVIDRGLTVSRLVYNRDTECSRRPFIVQTRTVELAAEHQERDRKKKGFKQGNEHNSRAGNSRRLPG